MTPDLPITTREHVAPSGFVCTFCRKSFADGCAFIAFIGPEQTPVDGLFCSESHAEAEATMTVLVDAVCERIGIQ